VDLTELVGGHTSRVYRVDAMRDPATRPLPYVAKFGGRKKVVEEYDRFVENVSDFVPFASRPNLVRERCLIGADTGVLVGQFIEHAEPLSDVVLRASSPQVLHGVFENLLHGWWRQGQQTVAPDPPVLEGIKDWYDTSGKPWRDEALLKHYRDAVTRYPGLLAPGDIRGRLAALGGSRHRRSLIHGDLHAGNIHVRGGDVFLIDFGSVVFGPTLADAAMLETSLVLSAGTACTRRRTRESWEDLTINQLYGPGWDTQLPPREPPHAVGVRMRRLWSAVRVIRLHAWSMQTTPREYATLVAAAMVRLASFDDPKPRQRTRCVGHLYGIASRIAAGLA
jgi:hypothetical protein